MLSNDISFALFFRHLSGGKIYLLPHFDLSSRISRKLEEAEISGFLKTALRHVGTGFVSPDLL